MLSRERWRATWSRIGPRVRDVVAIVLSAGAPLTVTAGGPTPHLLPRALEVAVGVLGAGALWWRRSHPEPVVGFGVVLALVTNFSGVLLFGLATLAIRRRDRILVTAAGVGFVVLTVSPVGRLRPEDWVAAVPGSIIGILAFVFGGAYVGARRDLLASLRDRAARAEGEREARAEQARLAERSRIAREMHDVLAHRVSLIALHAGALEVNENLADPQVRASAATIGSTARQAMDDLREVLGVLRSGSPPGAVELAPQPTAADLHQLVEASRSAAVPVQLTISGPALPEVLGRTVYRIVQEALTNVHKHAAGAATRIVLTTGEDGQVLVEVTNDRPAGTVDLVPGAGAGLLGLAERAQLAGGTLTGGPTPDGGWSIQAVLPPPARGLR